MYILHKQNDRLSNHSFINFYQAIVAYNQLLFTLTDKRYKKMNINKICATIIRLHNSLHPIHSISQARIMIQIKNRMYHILF